MFCPSCGKEVAQGSTFCNNCGKPIQSTSAPVTPQYQPQPMVPTKSKRNRNIGILVAFVIIVLGLALFASTLSTSVNVTGTNLDVNYTGITTGYFGADTQSIGGSISVNGGGQFTETLTLTDTAILLSHNINTIAVDTSGFTLVSIAPSLPITLQPLSSITITLIITAPSSSYSGPLTITMSTS